MITNEVRTQARTQIALMLQDETPAARKRMVAKLEHTFACAADLIRNTKTPLPEIFRETITIMGATPKKLDPLLDAYGNTLVEAFKKTTRDELANACLEVIALFHETLRILEHV